MIDEKIVTQEGSVTRCLLAAGNELGEGPVWSQDERKLFWVDIATSSIHSIDPDTGEWRVAAVDRKVSAILPRSAGGWLAVTEHGLRSLDFQAAQLRDLENHQVEPPPGILNDGNCDAQGRLWVGTMRRHHQSMGALYRVDHDLRWSVMDRDICVANGLDWSPDGTTLYVADTAVGRIYAYDFEIDAGAISRRRTFAKWDASGGRPDGVVVDAAGFVWCALWDGWCIQRYSPEGRLVQIVELPVPRPSSLAFGGDDLRTIFVTSAREGLTLPELTRAPLSGGLFVLEVPEPGRPTSKFAG